MVNVGAIRLENRKAAQEAAGDGQGGIEYRDNENHDGRGHSENRFRPGAPQHAVTAEEEADNKAAAVPQEDGSGIEVVAEETEKGAGNRGSGERKGNVPGDERSDQHGEGGEQADTGGQAVKAIDQVQGIRAADQPEHGKGISPPMAALNAGDGLDVETAPDREGGGSELTG